MFNYILPTNCQHHLSMMHAAQNGSQTIIAEISWDTLENIHYTNKYVLN